MKTKIYFLPIFIFLIIYVNSGFCQIVNLSYKNFTVSGNKEISEELTIKESVNVKKDATLTITGKLLMMPQAKLIVERGGKLVIDGGKVTSQDTILWEGIEVWGTASASQNPVEQGWVRVINDGVIENAKIGINAIKIDSQGGKEDYNYNYTGGIVEAKSADFINNEIAIRFYDYDNNSASSFFDCNFIVNDDYLSDDGPHYFIYFHNTHGIDITWCKFLNNSSNNCYGHGIYSFNSGFRIEGKCNSGTTPCTAWDYGEFKDLKYGIYATSAGTIYFPDIKHTRFLGNHRAVYFSALENGSVKSCDIFTGPNCDASSYGIYLDESTGYTIEENEFFEGNSNGIGLVVNKSGPAPNIIYNNIFWFS